MVSRALTVARCSQHGETISGKQNLGHAYRYACAHCSNLADTAAGALLKLKPAASVYLNTVKDFTVIRTAMLVPAIVTEVTQLPVHY